MTDVLISQKAKTAMSSGRAKTKQWNITFDRNQKQYIESTMGWTASEGTQHQVILNFDSLEAAIEYAKAQNLNYRVQRPHKPLLRPKNYMHNFTSPVLK